MHPEVGGKSERFGVDALVVAVEAGAERLERHRRREQAGAIGNDAALAEEPRIGATHDEARNEICTRIGHLGGRRQRVPQRIAAWRFGGIVLLEPTDLYVMGEVAERLVEVRIDIGLGGAGHGADVDLDLDQVGDDVRLLAAVHHVRRERGVRVGVTRASRRRRQLLDGRPDARRVEQTGLHLVG